MVVPRLFFCSARDVHDTGCFSLSELLVRKLYRWTRPCFSPTATFAASRARPPQQGFRPCIQRPNAKLRPVIRTVSGPFLAPQKSPDFGQTSPSPAASTGRRSCHSGTLRERPAGPKHTRAEQDQKLGRLHRARQALVRVPESSTKYGGKTEITGGAQPLRCRQLSVSPEGFPRKKLSDTRQPKLRPAVHRRTIYCRQGVALPRLTRSYRWAGQACPPIDGHGAKDTAWCRRFPTV